MRVKIHGESMSASALKGLLQNHKLVSVVSLLPSYEIFLEDTDDKFITFDSIDCTLEREILNSVRELTSREIVIKTQGGVQSDTQIRIFVPRDEDVQWAVETGIYRGLDKVLRKKRSFWRG